MKRMAEAPGLAVKPQIRKFDEIARAIRKIELERLNIQNEVGRFGRKSLLTEPPSAKMESVKVATFNKPEVSINAPPKVEFVNMDVINATSPTQSIFDGLKDLLKQTSEGLNGTKIQAIADSLKNLAGNALKALNPAILVGALGLIFKWMLGQIKKGLEQL
ncbi:MAG: hypothetical protein AB1468_04310, partial [Candidatus Micrarchaeota archaeon]